MKKAYLLVGVDHSANDAWLGIYDTKALAQEEIKNQRQDYAKFLVVEFTVGKAFSGKVVVRA